jgi:phosphoserine aminotransferase
LDYENILKQRVCITLLPFSVYASLTLQWLKKLGGAAAVEKLNNANRVAL